MWLSSLASHVAESQSLIKANFAPRQIPYCRNGALEATPNPEETSAHVTTRLSCPANIDDYHDMPSLVKSPFFITLSRRTAFFFEFLRS